jgi:spore coat polysaccharide biosynthesis predicted glycosyltransferase SpsG
MGMGHLFRMINLYRVLRHIGADAVVVLLGAHPQSSEWLAKANIPFEIVAEESGGIPFWDIDIALRYKTKVWINDRLQTDLAHADRIKNLGLRLVTFDDLGDGAARADLHVAAWAEVRGESPKGVKVLVGSRYIILAPEIARYRRQRIECNTLVVNLGGSDTHGVTVKVAQWLKARKKTATLVLGPGFSHDEALAGVMMDNITVKRSVPSLAAEFFLHDLAITGGGLTAFEAAGAGLPTVTIANEKWEVAHCLHLQTLGCSMFAGPYDNIDLNILDEQLDIVKMSAAAFNAVPLNGVDLICEKLMSLCD